MKNSCGSREKSEVHDMPETPLITIYRVVTIAKIMGNCSRVITRIGLLLFIKIVTLRGCKAALDDRRRENGKNKKLLLCRWKVITIFLMV